MIEMVADAFTYEENLSSIVLTQSLTDAPVHHNPSRKLGPKR
jgi:hypothetical protein